MATSVSEREKVCVETSAPLEQEERTYSEFRDGAVTRRDAMQGALDRRSKALGAPDYDRTPWGLLYHAMEQSLGVDPSNFQMLYPFTPWDWPTEQVGFIGAGQYNFCNVVPQWSAVGVYASSGDGFDLAYREFLNIIAAQTDDPDLRQKIDDAREELTAKTNDYTTTYGQAKDAYHDEVPDNDPPFDAWLGTAAGAGWRTQIESKLQAMNKAQQIYDGLVDQANTPGLADAQAQRRNQDFYSKLNDPGLSSFPKVPNWSIGITSHAWVERIKQGNGPAGGTVGFANRDQQYDYSNTWAKGSLDIKESFWQVHLEGKWQRVTQFETDQQLQVSVEFEALDQIQIQPSPWYDGAFVRSMASGRDFKRGYSPYGGDGTTAVFGEKGFFNLLKTNMFVCYKPTFTITTSQKTFKSFRESFEVSGGLRVGPFTFSAAGGATKAGWKASEQGNSFTGTSDSETPLIFGVTVAQLGPRKDPSETTG